MAFSKATALGLLQRAHGAGRLGHAYLISGPAGSGKRQLASDLAAMVCGPSLCATPLEHPDVHMVEPESKSRRIRIDQVRELERELQMRASVGGGKLGIVFEADRLNDQASNAFLKTLEEPPSNSLLVLTTTMPEALHDTIISRCISISLASGEEIAATAAQEHLLAALQGFFSSRSRDLGQIYSLVSTFMQILQAAKEEIKEGCEADLKKEVALYKQTTDGKYLEEREEYYGTLAESRYVLARFLFVDTVIQWWADVARQQQSYEHLDYPAFTADTARIAAELPTERVLAAIDRLEQLRDHLGRNVQEQLAVEVAFLRVFAA